MRGGFWRCLSHLNIVPKPGESGDTLTRFCTGLYTMVTAWRVEALVNISRVAVEVGERQVIADAQGRTADGTWLTTL